MTAAEIARLPKTALRDLLANGHPIDPAALDDSVYRGTSLGLPELVVRLTWRHFEKVFHRDPATGELRGWNIRVKDRHPFGPFAVVAANRYRTPGDTTPRHAVTTWWDHESGMEAVTREVAAGTDFDAVLGLNDALAFGAVRGLLDVGLRVPDDVLVAGIDDVHHARFTTPRLTSVDARRPAIVDSAVRAGWVG